MRESEQAEDSKIISRSGRKVKKNLKSDEEESLLGALCATASLLEIKIHSSHGS